METRSIETLMLLTNQQRWQIEYYLKSAPWMIDMMIAFKDKKGSK